MMSDTVLYFYLRHFNISFNYFLAKAVCQFFCSPNNNHKYSYLVFHFTLIYIFSEIFANIQFALYTLHIE